MEKMTKKIIVISGKARAGKDTTASMIKEILGEKCINLQYSTYIKDYAKKISDWDGSEETKPRELLQKLGTDIIRRNIDEEFFIKKMIEDLKVYDYFFEFVTISDARFKVEIDRLRENYDNVVALHIVRPNYDNGLTEEQKKHPSEVDLDDYNNFDYEIINDGSLDELREKVKKFIEVL